MKKFLIAASVLLITSSSLAIEVVEEVPEATVEVVMPNTNLAPLTERFILDEVKDLRIKLESIKREIYKEVIDREYVVVDRALSYSANTVSYFFFFITVAVGFLAVFGLRTLHDLKNSARELVEKKTEELVKEFRGRLEAIEEDLRTQGTEILENQKKLEQLQKVNDLWGEVHREKDDPRKLDLLEKIREMDPENVEIYATKSGSYLRLGLLDQALEVCDQALELMPDHPIALYNRACAHARLEDYEEAIKDLHHAISIAPNLRESMQSDTDFDELKKEKSFDVLLED